MEEKIEHEYTLNAVCPYCGYENEDSWELWGDDQEVMIETCKSCEQDFKYCREITVRYSTWKIGIAKKIILEELEEQSHPERVEDVIFWALEFYSKEKKGTSGSTIADYIVSRIKEEENNER